MLRMQQYTVTLAAPLANRVLVGSSGMPVAVTVTDEAQDGIAGCEPGVVSGLSLHNERMSWLIYGANGYTGELIARAAAERGMAPTLAGRTREKVEPLAAELGLLSRVFGLDDPDAVAANIAGMRVVLHCAGPFSATSAPVLEACLRAGVHYLDITGEIAVFETRSPRPHARTGGGRDLPRRWFRRDPHRLRGSRSHGSTARRHTALARLRLPGSDVARDRRDIHRGARHRRQGTARWEAGRGAMGAVTRRIDFGDGEKFAVAIPWGDVSTAYRTTGIGDIEVYVPTSPSRARQLRLANLARPLVQLRFVQQFLKSRVASKVTGPDANARAKSPTYVWGEVSNDRGERRVARIKTANGYDVTVAGALAAVRHLLDHTPSGGSYTPSQLLGADLVTTLPGSGRLILE